MIWSKLIEQLHFARFRKRLSPLRCLVCEKKVCVSFFQWKWIARARFVDVLRRSIKNDAGTLIDYAIRGAKKKWLLLMYSLPNSIFSISTFLTWRESVGRFIHLEWGRISDTTMKNECIDHVTGDIFIGLALISFVQSLIYSLWTLTFDIIRYRQNYLYRNQ